MTVNVSLCPENPQICPFAIYELGKVCAHCTLPIEYGGSGVEITNQCGAEAVAEKLIFPVICNMEE